MASSFAGRPQGQAATVIDGHRRAATDFGFYPSDNHTGGDGFVGAGIDEDEGAGDAVAAVGIMNEWHGGAQGDAADVVHFKSIDTFDFVEGVDINVIFHLLDDRFGFLGGVAEHEFGLGGHGLGGEPADHGFDILADDGGIVRFHQGIATRDIDFLGESDANGLRGEGFFFFTIWAVDGFDMGLKTGGQNGDFIAGFENTASDAPGVATEIMPLITHRADDPLHGEAGIDVVFLPADIDGLEVIEEGGAFIPRHFFRAIHDVVAIEGGDRDIRDLDDVIETGGEVVEILDDVVINFFRVIDEIHLVHGDDEVLDAKEVGDEAVALGLLDHAFTGIDEDDGKVRGGGTRDHVAGVLGVAWSVCDDEFALGCGKVTVGDINGDALLALGFESVCEKGEVDVFITAAAGGFLHGFELILEDGFGIIEKAANEGGFAVIDGAGGGEAEEVHRVEAEILRG